MPSPSSGRRRHAAPLIAIALLLAACSGSDGDSDAGGDGPGATTTSVAGDTTGGSEPLERYADHETEHYEDPARWICRPDVDDDICDGDLTTTIVEADGTMTVETFEADPEAPIDCFYVYPTISRDSATFADWDAGEDEEGFVTLQQAARLGSVCRVFAPIYRQRTLAGLGGGETGPDDPDPVADVTDAFRTYMANDNGGRGIVLIGHSQGAGVLRELLEDEFDPNPDVAELLVGAYLAGGSFQVPEGEVVGGDLENIPICTADGEAGCVISWAAYAADEPPGEHGIFGRSGEGTVAACTSPAATPGADGPVPLHAHLPANRAESILAGDDESPDLTWLAEGGDPVETPFVSIPGRIVGECVTEGAHSFLRVEIVDEGDDLRVDDIGGRLTPVWGLHLLDVNLVMGDIVERVADQAATYGG